MEKRTESGGRPRGHWRKAVWGGAALLWILILAVIQSTDGLNLALAVAVSAILMIPAGIYELTSALQDRSAVYRTAVGVALAGALLLGWANGAVGIIGSENQPANRLYAGVLVVGIVGAVIARFRPRGMTLALSATALAQLAVPVVALVIWGSELSWGGAGMLGVFGLNAFFAALFGGSALLFRHAARE